VLPGGSPFYVVVVGIKLSLALCGPQAHIQELAGTGRDAGAHTDDTVAPKPTVKISTPREARGSRRSCFNTAAGDGDGDGVRKEPPIQILGTLESKAPTSCNASGRFRSSPRADPMQYGECPSTGNRQAMRPSSRREKQPGRCLPVRIRKSFHPPGTSFNVKA
jgi:hypothetical protein